MPLPVLVTPTFEVTIPSTMKGNSPKKITMRPFLVKEQKILLMHQNSTNELEIYGVIKDVLNACILSEEVSVDNLSTFDVQYLFLKLRSRSINEKIKLSYNCPEEIKGEPNEFGVSETKKCGGTFRHVFDIEELKVEFPKKANDDISLSNGVGIKLKYPSFKDLYSSISEDGKTIDYKLIKKCTICIYDNDNVYDDYTDEEYNTFIDSLTPNQLGEISLYFADMPKINYKITFICPKCNLTEPLVLDTLSDFFE